MWRKLLDKAEDIQRREVKNGYVTSFWFDAWLDIGCFSDLVGVKDYIYM